MRSRVEKAGGEEGRDESVVRYEIGRDGRELTGEDGGGETKRRRRTRVVEKPREDRGTGWWEEYEVLG